MKSEYYLNNIIDRLSTLQVKIKSHNLLNRTDINIGIEFLFRDILNIILSSNLNAKSSVDPQAAAIDLYDDNLKFAVQVTSTSDLKKIKKTVNGFIKNEYHKKYDRLIILIVAREIKRKGKDFYPSQGDFNRIVEIHVL